jgi:hypothetical protein
MATLSARARHRKGEPDKHEQNARHVLELVESWGLPDKGRSAADEDVALWFDNLDTVEGRRTVADVWARRRQGRAETSSGST